MESTALMVWILPILKGCALGVITGLPIHLTLQWTSSVWKAFESESEQGARNGSGSRYHTWPIG